MNIHRITAGVQVRHDFSACYDFYTQQLGLFPIYGDHNGPYTSNACNKLGCNSLASAILPMKVLTSAWHCFATPKEIC
ncbi:MAG: hypothetical protein FWD06_04675 [Oscillospiraceae bacterium]|nr:hypothetical protein [Oscillospiraceae bacterium]